MLKMEQVYASYLKKEFDQNFGIDTGNLKEGNLPNYYRGIFNLCLAISECMKEGDPVVASPLARNCAVLGSQLIRKTYDDIREGPQLHLDKEWIHLNYMNGYGKQISEACGGEHTAQEILNNSKLGKEIEGRLKSKNMYEKGLKILNASREHIREVRGENKAN